jgi:hypothetical protein
MVVDGAPFQASLRIAGVTRAGRPSPPNSPPSSKAPAQKWGPSPMIAEAIALTITSAPTVCPDGVVVLAEPSPPLRSTVVAP